MAVPWMARLDDRLAEVGPNGFARCRTAATLLGLGGFSPNDAGFTFEPDVAVAYPRSPRRGVSVPRLSNVHEADLLLLGTTRSTGPWRTLVDIAGLGDADLAERAAESALRLGLLSEEQFRRFARIRSVVGAAVLREVERRRPPGVPVTESDAEICVVQLLRRAAIPLPQRQVRVDAGGRRFRVDLAYPLLRLFIEIDGRGAHGDDSFVNDRRRQNAIVNMGWTPLRFASDDVYGTPDAVAAVVADALRQRGWLG